MLPYISLGSRNRYRDPLYLNYVVFLFNCLTEVLCFQGGSAEVELKKGNSIRLTTDKAFENSGNEKQIYVDYANIVKVVKVNNRVFVDDGLISLIVKKIG